MGILAGPATEIAVAITLPPSTRQPLLIEGYRKSWVGGLPGSNAGAATGAGPGAGAGAGAGPGAGSAAAAGSTGADTGAATGVGTSGMTSATGPRALAGLMPAGR